MCRSHMEIQRSRFEPRHNLYVLHKAFYLSTFGVNVKALHKKQETGIMISILFLHRIVLIFFLNPHFPNNFSHFYFANLSNQNDERKRCYTVFCNCFFIELSCSCLLLILTCPFYFIYFVKAF